MAWGLVLPVYAQQSASTAAYDALIDRALAAYKAGQFAESRTYFEQAHAERPSARTWRGLGMSSFALDRYSVARNELEAALGDTRRPLVDGQRAEVERTLDWMRTNLGSLQLAYSPTEAEALVDEHSVSAGAVLLDPGLHHLHLRAPGYTPRDETFKLTAQQSLSLRVELSLLQPKEAPELSPTLATPSQPPRDPAPSDSPAVYERWWFWAGVAAVVGGGIALAFALREPRDTEYGSQSAGVNATVLTLRSR